jgi:hypothetical protein
MDEQPTICDRPVYAPLNMIFQHIQVIYGPRLDEDAKAMRLLDHGLRGERHPLDDAVPVSARARGGGEDVSANGSGGPGDADVGRNLRSAEVLKLQAGEPRRRSTGRHDGSIELDERRSDHRRVEVFHRDERAPVEALIL